MTVGQKPIPGVNNERNYQMKILITAFALSFMFSSPVLAKPQDGPSTKAECGLIGGTFKELGGGMTSCCTDKGCTICDHTGCHFDEAMDGKTKPKKPKIQDQDQIKGNPKTLPPGLRSSKPSIEKNR